METRTEDLFPAVATIGIDIGKDVFRSDRSRPGVGLRRESWETFPSVLLKRENIPIGSLAAVRRNTH
ncbi:hypothetical protein [Sinorhizobium fredii]|uniref:hypothetical protein n=1 Tax=Rhizobium fredii TaxID=380 RepID=UPI0004AD5DBD|nr:hypothetical protein [Sinorhizobium fredii]